MPADLAEVARCLPDEQDAEPLEAPVVRRFKGYLQLDFTYRTKSNQYTGLL